MSRRAEEEQPYRIALRPDSDGALDDVVVNEVSMFRLERMTDTAWWAACYFADAPDQELCFWFSIQNGELVCEVTDAPHGKGFDLEVGSIEP